MQKEVKKQNKSKKLFEMLDKVGDGVKKCIPYALLAIPMIRTVWSKRKL